MSLDSIKFEVAALTHRGAIRDHNEDVVGIADRVLSGDLAKPVAQKLGTGRHLLVVADGMGGHAFGELASRTAVEAVVKARQSFADEAGCRRAIAAADASIHELMRSRPETIGMGTTIVGASLDQNELLCFNVGDSRAYRHSPGRLVQISRDHVPEVAGFGRRRVSHVITQCLGGYPDDAGVDPHVTVAPALRPGESLLLCSDGLTDMIGDDEIEHVLQLAPEPQTCVQGLSELAMQAGGIDNISVVLVRRVG